MDLASARALGAFAFLCLATSAWSEEVKPVNVPCKPLSDVKDAAKYRWLNHDEWEVARAIFFLAPGTPTSVPPGDAAMISEDDDGGATLVFVDGDEVCAPIHLLKDSLKLLSQIKSGVVTHPPGRM